MTYQPGEPSYVPPQDPWGDTSSTASAPTEPLPAPARGPDQFAPGVASPAAWSATDVAVADPQPTVRSGGGRAGLYVLVFLVVVVVAGAGGFASWWVTTRYAGQLIGAPTTPTSTTTSSEPSRSPSPDPRPTEFLYADDPFSVEEGTCLENRGTQRSPEMWVVPCDRPGSYEVLAVFRGDDIPEDESGNFTKEATADVLCDGLPSDAWFGWNNDNNALDLFYCMKRRPAV